MKNIRHNVFETNSSSVHTITLDGNALNDLRVEEDGYIHLTVRSYGKEYDWHDNAEDKLIYAILTVCYTNGIYLDWYYDSEEPNSTDYEEQLQTWNMLIEDLKDTPEYQLIEAAVKDELKTKHIACKGIKFLPNYAWIDHQSQIYDSLDDFLTSNNIDSVREFIFGKAILHTDID